MAISVDFSKYKAPSSVGSVKLPTKVAPKTQYTNSLSTLNLSNVSGLQNKGITSKNLIPARVGGVDPAPRAASPGATAPTPTRITTPQSSSVQSPAAQQFVSQQMQSPGAPLPTKPEVSAPTFTQDKDGGIRTERPERAPKAEKTSYQIAMDSYLNSLKGSNRANEAVEKAGIGARRGYLETLDTPGGLKQGAQESAARFSRDASNNLADLGVAQNAATNAESVALRRLELEQGLLPSTEGFSLSAGQQRFDSTGKLLASGGPDTPSTPASIQEYNFARQQGYAGSFDEFKNSGASNNPNAILSPSEAQALGVPYGTTRGAATGMGITPTKPLTETQAKDLTYGTRGQEANSIIDQLAGSVIGMNPVQYAAYAAIEPNALGNSFVPNNVRQMLQAQRNFLNAVLRRESGAVISPTEFANGSLQYFPRPGDDEQTLIQKAQNRATSINSFLKNAGQSGVQGGASGGGLFDW